METQNDSFELKLVLSLLFVMLCIFGMRGWTSPVKKQNISQKKVEHANFVWIPTNANPNEFVLFIDDTKYPGKTYGSYFPKSVASYLATVAYSTNSPYHDFYKFYDDLLTKDGFTQARIDITKDNISIAPLSADGPNGSNWGYVKVDNDKVLYIVFENRLLKDSNPNKEDDSDEKICPCEEEYKITVSDPFTIDKKKIEWTSSN